LAKRIKKPRAWVSFLSCLANIYSRVKNWLQPCTDCANCISTIETGVNMF
jgi:hypothetical protein